MQILSIYNNQVLRGRDEEREKWINIVRTIFFFSRRTYEKNTLETTIWLVCVHMEAHKNSIFHVDHMLQPTCTHHKVVISWCALLCGHRAFVCIQNSMSELIFILFYFTYRYNKMFILSFSNAHMHTHWLLPHNNIEFNQNHFYLVQKLRQTDMHQFLNRKEKRTTKSRASI